MPEAKSTYSRPSTSQRRAPSARAAKRGRGTARPRATAAALRPIHSSVRERVTCIARTPGRGLLRFVPSGSRTGLRPLRPSEGPRGRGFRRRHRNQSGRLRAAAFALEGPHVLARTRASALAVLLFLAMVAPALAGTTGGLRGRVVDAATGLPLAGAKVSAVSPSQSQTEVTGSDGVFAFISLAPDTYLVSVEKTGYDAFSTAGVT